MKAPWGDRLRVRLARDVGRFLFQDQAPRAPKIPQDFKSTPTGGRTILQVNTDQRLGGAAKIAFELFRGLSELGWKTEFLVHERQAEVAGVFEIRALKGLAREILNRAAENQGWQDLGLPLIRADQNPVLNRASLIHLHNTHGNYFHPAHLPYWSTQRPLVWTLHDMFAFTGHCSHSLDCEKWQTGCGACPHLKTYPAVSEDRTNELWQLKKAVYSQSRLTVVTPSEWLAKKARLGILKDHPVTVITNGIDLKVFQPRSKELLRRKWGFKEDSKILLFAAQGGEENPFKGGRFIQALVKAYRAKTDVELISLGGSRQGLEGNLHRLPYQHDPVRLAELYCLSDLMVYPSLADTAPLVLMEAQACGLPVVTFNTGGIPEIVANGVTGLVVSQAEEAIFFEAVTSLLENSILRAKLARACRPRAETFFDLRRMLAEYSQLYDTLLPTEGASR